MKDGVWVWDSFKIFRMFSRFLNIYVGVLESNL